MSISKTKQAYAINTLLNTLVKSQFYGAVTVKFEDGNVVHVKVEKNLKIETIIEDFDESIKKIMSKDGIYGIEINSNGEVK